MKTSAIHHRVADFLKGFPPFCYLNLEELEAIAAKGRVRFHEPEEILFEAGDTYSHQIHVIQQGTIQLSRPTKSESQTVDLLGSGDIAGFGRFLGRTAHEHTATTLTEAVVYALDFATFSHACAESAQATRFLQIQFAADQVEMPDAVVASESGGALEIARPFVTCRSTDTIRAVAKIMCNHQLAELLVADPSGHPVGIVTDRLLREALAAEFDPNGPVAGIMAPVPPTISPDENLDQCLLQVIRNGCSCLCVTQDGTHQSKALALVTERDLLLWKGDNPSILTSALRESRSLLELAGLRRHASTLVEKGLKGFQNLDWHVEFIAEANRSLLSNLLGNAIAATASSLGPQPGVFCLALVGQAGRGELLTPLGLETILIVDESAAAADSWYASLANHLVASLNTCGFPVPPSGISIAKPEFRQSLKHWSASFRSWITSPIECSICEKLPFFDFSPVQPRHPLAIQLRDSIRGDLAACPNFVRILANDCLENSPPLTILEGYAVDSSGLHREELELRAHALQPVTDVARVFQLGSANVAITSTLARLAHASEVHPEAAAIFEQAARAFRIALGCGTGIGLKSGTDGAKIRPTSLSRADQVLLKSGFQSIAGLLAHAAKAHGLQF